MDNRSTIQTLFRKFILALQENSFPVFDEVFTKGTEFQTQHLGCFIGAEEAKAAFRWKGPRLNISRYQIYNHTLFNDSERAVQSAYLVALVGYVERGYLHHFQFGGHFLNSWRKIDGDWKITTMKFALDMEFGNTAFVSGWWKLIDYTVYGGYQFHPINSPIEAPWRQGISQDNWTEEEQVRDLYNRYAWGIDENDFALTASALAEDVTTHIPGQILRSREELIAMLRSKRDKENTMSHVGKFAGVSLNHHSATLFMRRYEPHRIGTRILHKGNVDTQFYSVQYTFSAEKKDSAWTIRQIDYDIRFLSFPYDGEIYQ
jgi:hypothetical protein